MSLNGKHILVLEDEPIIAFALEDMLIEEGATVSVFSSIEQAREGLLARDVIEVDGSSR